MRRTKQNLIKMRDLINGDLSGESLFDFIEKELTTEDLMVMELVTKDHRTLNWIRAEIQTRVELKAEELRIFANTAEEKYA